MFSQVQLYVYSQEHHKYILPCLVVPSIHKKLKFFQMVKRGYLAVIIRSLNCELMSCTKHIYVAQEGFIFDQIQRCTVLQSVYFEMVLVLILPARASTVQSLRCWTKLGCGFHTKKIGLFSIVLFPCNENACTSPTFAHFCFDEAD